MKLTLTHWLGKFFLPTEKKRLSEHLDMGVSHRIDG